MTDQEVHCESCQYTGSISTYGPVMSIYNDIRCPKCSSTANAHNAAYQDRLFKAMKKPVPHSRSEERRLKIQQSPEDKTDSSFVLGMEKP